MSILDLLRPFRLVTPKEVVNAPSVILISMYKGGSTFLQQTLKTLLLSRGYEHVDFAGEAFRAGWDEGQYCIENSRQFVQRGKFFGAFRGAYAKDFADMSGNKILIHIRDPRDCVVSLFFSWAYSHVAPGGDKKEAFMELREQTRTKDINDFVLERARDFADILDSIQLVADRYPSAFVSRYEDMLTEFEPWLNKVQAFLGLVFPESAIQQVRASATFSVKEEDVSRHVRQVTPGDHKRKLTPEVQEQLTQILRPQLERFGYIQPTTSSDETHRGRDEKNNRVIGT
jgi:hypothetical protein